MFTSASSTLAQSAPSNGCVPTPDTVDPTVMVVQFTDTCPLGSYHLWQTVVAGEYDASTLDYAQVGKVVSLVVPPTRDNPQPQLGVLIPASTLHYRDGSVVIQDKPAAWLAADRVRVRIGTIPPPGDGSIWVIGFLTPDERAYEAPLRAYQQAIGPSGPDDVCGPLARNDVRFRLVVATATCTETTFQRDADLGVPNYLLGGTQFMSTSPTGQNWLLAATAERDDGNAELMILIPVSQPDSPGDEEDQVFAPQLRHSANFAAGSIGAVWPDAYISRLLPADQRGHTFITMWSATN